MEAIHQGFVASVTHYANLIDTVFTEVGFGIVHTADGRVYLAAVYMLPEAAPPSAPVAAPVVATTNTTAADPPIVAAVVSPEEQRLFALLVSIIRTILTLSGS